MSGNRAASIGSTRLPKALIDQLTHPFGRFLRIEAAGGAVLLLCTLVAFGLSNSPWFAFWENTWETSVGLQLGSFEFMRSLREWINDGLMTLFFFLVALELKRELVLGELKNLRIASLSVAGALGGMLVPAALYVALQWDQPGRHGWGTVMATDTAFVMGCLALLGSRIPESLRVFMLSLAIVDDIGAIVIVALAYGNQLNWGAIGLAAVGVGTIRLMSAFGIRSFLLYSLVGVGTWLCVDASGIHATVTGVLLGLMTPARRWVSDDRLYAILGQVVAHPGSQQSSGDTKDRKTLQIAAVAARETLSPAERLEIILHPWVGFVIMPLFALANAGLRLPLGELDTSVTVAVFVGLALGKPIGIFAFSWLAVRMHVAACPSDLQWRSVAGGGLLAGIGFTMALFIANLAYASDLIDSAKLGIFLAALVSAFAGLLLLWFPLGRRGRTVPT